MTTSGDQVWEFSLRQGWVRIKLKYVASLKGRLGWQNLRADEYTNEGPFLVTSEHFRDDMVDWDRCHHVTQERYEMAPEIQLRPEDLLMMKDGAAMGKLAYINAIPGPACLNSHLLLFRPSKGRCLNRFVYFILLTPLFHSFMRQRRTGTTFYGITQESIENFPISIPSVFAQMQIVQYLDCKTTEIDDLISKKRRMIDLLHEKRQALISEVITKGLDPDVPMKASDTDWMGVVPSHWSVERLKYSTTRIEQGWSPQCESRPADPEEWGVLKVGCVNGEDFNPEEQKALPSSLEPIEEYEIRSGDILMSRGNTRELVGSAALVKRVRPRLLLCDLLYRFRSNRRAEPEFLVHSLRSPHARFQIEREATGTSSSMKKVGQETIRELLVCLPPLPEQRVILQHLRPELDRIKLITKVIHEQINKLREYRQTLISAAVTGKIDVTQEIK